MKSLILIIFILLSASCVNQKKLVSVQEKIPSGKVLQYGSYKLKKGGTIITDSKTSTGKSLSKVVLNRKTKTTQILLKKNNCMAYKYRLSNLPGKGKIKLRRILKHPPITLPDGSITTGSDFFIIKKLLHGEVFAFDAYVFNENYEMVEGTWSFEIWFNKKKLVEQIFTTYPEDQLR